MIRALLDMNGFATLATVVGLALVAVAVWSPTIGEWLGSKVQ